MNRSKVNMIPRFFVFGFYLITATACPAVADETSKKPNILWIITDDQRSDSLACYNRVTTGKSDSELGYVESPNIDQLASEGVFFTNAFCNSMACAPSRSSMHTGKYVHRNGMYGFRKAHQAAGCSSKVIPQVLKENGYQSSLFGKGGFYIFDWEKYNQWGRLGYYTPEIHRNELEKTDGSDFWFNRPWGQHNGKGMVLGTEEVYRFKDGATKRFWLNRKDRELSDVDRATRKSVEKELDILRSYTRARNKSLIIGGVSPNETDKTLDASIGKAFSNYLKNADQTFDMATGEVGRGPDPTKPIFAHVSFCFPHTPVLPSQEFRERFADKHYKIPEFSEAEANLMAGSLGMMRADMDCSAMKPEDKQQAIRDYYAFCAMGDYIIGKTVKSFKEYCQKNDQQYVIVYVCGDHGWHLGEQGIEAKFGPWFQTTHDSIIVVSSDKGKFPPGKVCHDMVEFVDLAPTFYEVAGVDHNEHPGLDGISLTTTMNEGAQRDYVIGEMNQVRGDWAYLRSHEFNFAMRVRPFFSKPGEGYEPCERIRWGLEAPAKAVDMALYDLRVDPKERVNVAYEEHYAKLATHLRTKLATIVLGDGRVECDWTKENHFKVSNFAPGAHDRKLTIPDSILPAPNLPTLE